MDLVQPEPELAPQIAEALFVVGPVPVEVDGAGEPFLEDGPASPCIFLVAVNVKGALVVGFNRVDTVGSPVSLVVLRAVFEDLRNLYEK